VEDYAKGGEETNVNPITGKAYHQGDPNINPVTGKPHPVRNWNEIADRLRPREDTTAQALVLAR
jgi:hypothetical protein